MHVRANTQVVIRKSKNLNPITPDLHGWLCMVRFGQAWSVAVCRTWEQARQEAERIMKGRAR